MLGYDFREKGVIKVSGERYLSDAVSDFEKPRRTLSSGWEQPGPRRLEGCRDEMLRKHLLGIYLLLLLANFFFF